MKGFSIDEFRELNTVKLIASQSTSTSDVIFQAYLLNGFSFGVDIRNSGFNTEKLSGLGGEATVGKVLAQELELPVGIDIRSTPLYGGTSRVAFNLETFLYVKTSYKKDIVEPLNKLMEWCLPYRDTTKTSQDVVNAIDNSLSKLKSNAKTDIGGEIWAALQAIVNKSHQMVGDVVILYPPKMFNTDYTVSLLIGKFKYEDVIVENFRVNIPPLVYAGGAPDHVKVSITVRTLRVATTNSMLLQ